MFKPGVSGNPNGRPKREPDEKLMTNKKLREKAFLELVRKFRPLQAKALNAAVSILDNQQAGDQNKLKAAALIIGTYKELIKETYDYRYDNDEGEEMQKETPAQPVFSLKLIDSGSEEK